MTPTCKLRLIQRATGNPNPDGVRMILQQWWEYDGADDPEIAPIGEWRDVPWEQKP